MRYARHLLIRKFRFSILDVEDVLAQAMADYLLAVKRLAASGGLFLVIVHRRAADLRRRLSLERRAIVAAAVSGDSLPDGALEECFLLGTAARFAQSRPRLHRGRLVAVVRRVLGGDTLAEACRESGVPRGSQRRYRLVLQECFRTLKRSPSPGEAAPVPAAPATTRAPRAGRGVASSGRRALPGSRPAPR